MNRYFALSSGLHLTLAILVILLFNSAKQESSATYTIDFIGSGKVMSMQAAAVSKAAETAKEIAQPAPKEPEIKKPAPKAYDSKSEISTKKQTKPKPKTKPAPLAAPSILDEADNTNQSAQATTGADGEGDFEGGSIQTDFATFPYPWYITQVRNNLWSEWEKRRPVGVTRSTMVSFAIAYDGKIKDLKVAKSSGDDSFDFSAKSAVINAGPFPPLPEGYDKDKLTVTVEFKQEK